ncbi:MAG TPA: multicopper oxidase family protein [Chthoniobacterales bacterium]
MSSPLPPDGWTRREAIRVGLGTIAAVSLGGRLRGAEASEKRVRLFVREVPIMVHGRKSMVTAIEQGSGTHGYSPTQAEGFHVEVINELKVPTSVHWHGLIVPDLMDGVPWVTQEPIPAGGSMKFDFPLKQSGTYWMHSHYGLQEQYLDVAPLIIWTPEERALADSQFVVMLSDFTFTPAAEVLDHLRNSTGMSPMHSADMSMQGDSKMRPGEPEKVYAQGWENGRFVRKVVEAKPADIDVHYDALLANRRTLDDVEQLRVAPGESVLLRLVGASSATDFYIDTGELEAELLAVDGEAVEPLRGNYFQLAVAQRIDLRVKIPREGGAFPILGQGEGTKLLAGVVLATDGATVKPLPTMAELSTATLDNTQERRLRAIRPLSRRAADRTLEAALGGKMMGYIWTINGEAYPNRNSLDVTAGERVEVEFTNATGMGHPMHLHGHVFQVIEIDGERISGAVRDTVEVPPGSRMTIAFDADNPGIWAFHCHIVYHMATGMFTVVKYAGADTRYWKPQETPKEIQSL